MPLKSRLAGYTFVDRSVLVYFCFFSVVTIVRLGEGQLRLVGTGWALGAGWAITNGGWQQGLSTFACNERHVNHGMDLPRQPGDGVEDTDRANHRKMLRLMLRSHLRLTEM